MLGARLRPAGARRRPVVFLAAGVTVLAAGGVAWQARPSTPAAAVGVPAYAGGSAPPGCPGELASDERDGARLPFLTRRPQARTVLAPAGVVRVRACDYGSGSTSRGLYRSAVLTSGFGPLLRRYDTAPEHEGRRWGQNCTGAAVGATLLVLEYASGDPVPVLNEAGCWGAGLTNGYLQRASVLDWDVLERAPWVRAHQPVPPDPPGAKPLVGVVVRLERYPVAPFGPTRARPMRGDGRRPAALTQPPESP